eukprot:TRINITY_DN6792_c0_g2_i1.p1 TRINITY_DN6792_c0_g2~~TRINITY_DN6792_c0_g2_i1.p1  ORF type:complete len:127 (+),score=0.44 TRINITY_DN6792_c0_g2_i1:127-507(+)
MSISEVEIRPFGDVGVCCGFHHVSHMCVFPIHASVNGNYMARDMRGRKRGYDLCFFCLLFTCLIFSCLSVSLLLLFYLLLFYCVFPVILLRFPVVIPVFLLFVPFMFKAYGGWLAFAGGMLSVFAG